MIDFVLVSSDITVLCHRSVEDRPGGRFLSDHLPVLAVVALPDAAGATGATAETP